MSMRFKRQYEILQQRKDALTTLHRRMIETHMSHTKYLDARTAIMTYPKGFPRHYVKYIRGFADALINSLYYREVLWMHSWKGELFASWDTLPEEAKDFYRRATGDEIQKQSHFYWKDSQDIFS